MGVRCRFRVLGPSEHAFADVRGRGRLWVIEVIFGVAFLGPSCGAILEWTWLLGMFLEWSRNAPEMGLHYLGTPTELVYEFPVLKQTVKNLHAAFMTCPQCDPGAIPPDLDCDEDSAWSPRSCRSPRTCLRRRISKAVGELGGLRA